MLKRNLYFKLPGFIEVGYPFAQFFSDGFVKVFNLNFIAERIFDFPVDYDELRFDWSR